MPLNHEKNLKNEYDEYTEASAEIDDRYQRAENDGMTVKRPDLWKAARQKVKAAAHETIKRPVVRNPV
jgi:hypothetical protein